MLTSSPHAVLTRLCIALQMIERDIDRKLRAEELRALLRLIVGTEHPRTRTFS